MLIPNVSSPTLKNTAVIIGRTSLTDTEHGKFGSNSCVFLCVWFCPWCEVITTRLNCDVYSFKTQNKKNQQSSSAPARLLWPVPLTKAHRENQDWLTVVLHPCGKMSIFGFFFLIKLIESCVVGMRGWPHAVAVPGSAWKRQRCEWCAGWGISTRISLGKCCRWRKSRPASSHSHFPDSSPL